METIKQSIAEIQVSLKKELSLPEDLQQKEVISKLQGELLGAVIFYQIVRASLSSQ